MILSKQIKNQTRKATFLESDLPFTKHYNALQAENEVLIFIPSHHPN